MGISNTYLKMSKNHTNKEFRLMRSVVIWLNGYNCFVCKKNCKNIQVHHIDENSANNEITNLMPVCGSCHKLVHRSSKMPAISYNQIIILLLRKIELFTIFKNHKL